MGLEEMRDDRLSAIFVGIQACIRVKLEKTEFVRRLERREASRIIQSNIRAFLYVRDWEWMKIMYKIKPLLQSAEAAKEMEEIGRSSSLFGSRKERLGLETPIRRRHFVRC